MRALGITKVPANPERLVEHLEIVSDDESDSEEGKPLPIFKSFPAPRH
jgi:hypothetical protein